MNGQQIAERLRTRSGLTLILAALAMIQVVLYLQTLKYQFVWDDRLLIVENRLLTKAGPWGIFTRPFWSGTEVAEWNRHLVYYRPLTTLSFWLDLKFAGLNPAYFHLVNVVLAAISTVLVALIVWELLHSGVWAGIAGLLFATHPAHVESIAFISGRTDLLLTVFIAGAGFALLRSFRKRDRRWWWLVPPLFLFGVLSKETGIMFPVLVLLTPLLIQVRPLRGFYLMVLGVFLAAAAYLVMRWIVFRQALPMPAGFFPVDLTNAINTFGYYIRMFFWPFDHHAKIPINPAFLKPQSYFLYALIFLFSVPLAALRPRFRLALWNYAWTFLLLLPVSNIIPLGPQAAERLLYPASAGLVGLVIVILSRLLWSLNRTRQAAGVLLMLTAVLFGYDSFRRMPVWENELSLFSVMVREAPGAPSAYMGLARVLSPSNPDSAIRLLNRAIILDQGLVEAHINIAGLYARKGDLRRMFHHLRLAEELEPGSARVHNNFGYGYLFAGRFDSARVRFEQALAIDSTLAPSLLGQALAAGIGGRTPEAGRLFNRLLAVEPSWRDSARLVINGLYSLQSADTSTLTAKSRALLVNRLGSLLVALGDTAPAELYYRRALELDPDCVPALYNLAVLMINRGNRAEALVYVRQALRLMPGLRELQELKARLE
ncbi:MAG: tetratricopeptide repeat protein [candidate division WOR-3 bacterium]|uniref:Tetratricopeptide repeat protein n=1 Tax=candidate division WOR-3 bacterium TaxID=2052148 RepID=A0A7C3ESJ8_UNCW3|nr:tetratricopeptide repeat protein [candidate division WOR-3 bacterium]